MTPRLGAAARAAALWLVTCPLCAQGWAADVHAGGTRYDVLLGHVSATNLVGNLRYRTSSGNGGYLSAGAPLDAGAALWGAAGVRGLFLGTPTGGLEAGIDVGADGYAYDDSAGSGGRGAILRALPMVRWLRGPAAVELRAGAHRHVFTPADSGGRRDVIELSGRAGAGVGPLAVTADVRWLAAEEGSYPYLGAQVASPEGGPRLWAWAGRWLAEELDDFEWGVGASLPVGALGELWVTVREDGADPIYLGSARRAWNVGVSRTFGAPRRARAELVPRVASGVLTIRLPSRLVEEDQGAPSVAGEFSGWRPLPMTRRGDEWALEVPVSSGVYRFAFVRADGEWFVPDGYPGRIDDGFGGHVVLLVVP